VCDGVSIADNQRYITEVWLMKGNRVGNSVVNTVKPAHVVTSIKQSPVLKGHLFLVLL